MHAPTPATRAYSAPARTSAVAVDVWWLRSHDFAPSVLDALLSDSERRGTAHGPSARAHSRRAARALLRLVAAQRLGSHPRDVDVERRCGRCGSREHGRPYVADAPFGLSTATTAEIAIVAVGPPAIGVDVVMRGEADVAMEGAPAVLRCSATDTLAAMPAGTRGEAALTAVAQVEAYAKATGLGLPAVVGQVTVSLDPAAPAVDAAGRTWLARRVDLDRDHIAMLVTDPSASGIFVRPAARLLTEPRRHLRLV